MSRQDLKRIARCLVGLRFEDGGRGPDAYDCWGLVREVYQQCGIELPNYPISCQDAAAIAAAVNAERRLDLVRPVWRQVPAAQPLAVVVFCVRIDRFPTHLGVCIDAATALHTMRSSGACLLKLDSTFWAQRIVGYYEWIG